MNVEGKCPQKSEEGIRTLGARVPGSCELLIWALETEIESVLCERNKHSYPAPRRLSLWK